MKPRSEFHAQQAALLRQLKEVDRKIQKATDPACTVLGGQGVALLKRYRAQLDKQLETLIQQHESQSTKVEQGEQI